MRSKGSATELEHRRCLAVQRVFDGYSAEEVADFLGVDGRSVRRWVAQVCRQGWASLAAQPCPGRPRKLTHTQEKIALRWLRGSPTDHGFATELWTAARLAQLIRKEWDVSLHARSLRRWLREHGFSLQKPQRVPRERDPAAIAAWLATDWPRIKKKRVDNRPPWC
jgi:transposase